MISDTNELQKLRICPRYRKISRGSNADQSLFGNTTAKTRLDKARESDRGVELSHVSMSDTSPNVVSFVSSRDLNRIRDCLTLKTSSTDDNSLHTVPYSDELNKATVDNADLERSKARKQHMIELELNSKNKEVRAGQSSLNSNFQTNQKQACIQINPNEDIVKLLNTCCQRAAAFAIRDEQVKDKLRRDKEEHDFNRQMDYSMEIYRLKEIAACEAKEKPLLEKRKEVQKIIEQQLHEREQQRLLEEESKDQRNREMLEEIRKRQVKEQENATKRTEAALKAQLETIQRNNDATTLKARKKELEKLDDEQIIAYQRQRDKEMRKREDEEREATFRKQELQRKLLESQAKLLDRRAEMDEIRARRATEEAERRHRQKVLAEAQKRKSDLDTLSEARKRQEDEKRARKEKEACDRQEEHAKTLQNAAEMGRREKQEAEELKAKNTELRSLLQRQMEEKELDSRVRHQKKNEEGRLAREQWALDRSKLEARREKIVLDLKEKGVQEKFFGEILSLDIDKYLLR